ncbi:MAG: RIP metalloprotease RseP [Spirochaetaceae bacterium]|jgi:regulator of sigma E protease|nr:RIP metalloprotease RseP [Spirochaetaceae bacterium]
MTILLGLIALSFLVIIHEAGHFFAARISGVTVETFSIGMGPVVLHKKSGPTDYRLSLIPFGGYCGMKGEKDFQKALDEKLTEFPRDPESFYGVHPLKRLFIAFAGPFCNILFAALAFTLIGLAGYTYYSADNRIILADEISPGIVSAARSQGLKTGDRILSLNNEPTETFLDITRIIATHPEEDVSAEVERDGRILRLTLHPALEKSSASGKIGVYNWIDPVVGEVPPESSAGALGLQRGDVITAVDGEEVAAAAQVFKLLEGKTTARLTCRRVSPGGGESPFDVTLSLPEDSFSFAVPARKSKRYSLIPALGYGVTETGKMLGLTVKSIGMLFRGADLSSSVSGPVRISYIIGDTVKSGFQGGFNHGFTSVLNLLALISVSLFIMNLLPVPLLDGGLVFFSLIETIIRRPLNPRFLYYIQFAGIGFIALLFGFALFSDAKYFLGVLRK